MPAAPLVLCAFAVTGVLEARGALEGAAAPLGAAAGAMTAAAGALAMAGAVAGPIKPTAVVVRESAATLLAAGRGDLWAVLCAAAGAGA